MTLPLRESRPRGQEHRPEERDEGSHRDVALRPPASNEQDGKNNRDARHLGKSQRDEGPSPAESRAQHGHQLDIASTNATPTDYGDEENDAPTRERANASLDQPWLIAGHGGQAERVRQSWQGDEVGDHPNPHVENDDHRQCHQQWQELPPARYRTQPSKGQQAKNQSEPSDARQGARSGDLDERALYFWDGDPVDGCPGLRRGAR